MHLEGKKHMLELLQGIDGAFRPGVLTSLMVRPASHASSQLEAAGQGASRAAFLVPLMVVPAAHAPLPLLHLLPDVLPMPVKVWPLLCSKTACSLFALSFFLLPLSPMSAGSVWRRENNFVSLLLRNGCTLHVCMLCFASADSISLPRRLTAVSAACRMDVLSGDLLLWILATRRPPYAFRGLPVLAGLQNHLWATTPPDFALLLLVPAAASARSCCPG